MSRQRPHASAKRADRQGRGRRRTDINIDAEVAALINAKTSRLLARHPALRTSPPASGSGLMAFDQSAIVLGRNDAGVPVALPLSPRLAHMHVIGATGSGKRSEERRVGKECRL